MSKQVTPTYWRGHRGGKVRYTGRKRESEALALTPWSAHRDRQVKTRKESERARSTDIVLESATEATNEDIDRKRENERNSRSEEHIGQDK